MSVDAYLGERAARVELASGQKAIVESLAPLRSPDETGELEPIDLTLRDAGDAFAPVHGVSKVRLPKRLRGGNVELGGSGLRIEIAAPQSDTPGSAEDGGVFYANAEASTDVIVVPEMTGVEVTHFLRSAEAPERFVLGYGGGVVLREAQEGGVDVLRDGKLVAQVSPPTAWDADGQPVPMRLQADGDQLVIEVDHRDGDFTYPIVADPYTGEDFAYSDGRTAWWDQTGWDRVSTAASGNPRRFFEDQQCTDTGGRFCFGHWPGWIYGTGLYTWMRSGHTPGFNNTYNYGDIGEWIYQAPGQSYIYRFDMWQLRNEYDSSCSYQGLFSPRSNSWEEQSYWDPWGGATSPSRPAGDYPPRMSCGTSNTDWLAVCAGQWECRDGEADYSRHIREGGNYAVFGTQILNTQIPSFTNFMGAANISIGDRDNPQINTLTGPTGWTNDASAKINTSASDPGLGVRQLKLYAPDQPTWNGTRDTEPVCNGDRNSRCSTWRAHTVDVGDLREGRNRILAEATDPVDRRSPTREISVDVDRNGPDIDASGFLIDAGGQLTAGVRYDLDATVTDATSGITSVALLRDGSEVDSSDCGAARSCTVNLGYQPAASDAGSHSMQVVAYDQARNPGRSQVIPVDVDATPITQTLHELPDPEMSDDVQATDYDDPPVVTDGDNPNGYCDPNSSDPDARCDAPVEYSSADRAALDEPALSLNQTSPFIIGLLGLVTTRAAPGPGAPKDLNRGATGWGLADEKNNLFTQPAPGSANRTAIDDLSVGRVRKIIAFDAVLRAQQQVTYPAYEGGSCGGSGTVTVPKSANSRNELDAWLQTNYASGGYEPLISFQLSKGDDGKAPGQTFDRVRCARPTPTQYATAVQAVLDRYRQMRSSTARPLAFTAWNEPNLGAQPTHDATGMRRAGQYYTVLRRLCAQAKYGCTVAAGDLLDDRTILKHIEEYKKGVKYRNGNNPAVWALHPYGLARIADPAQRQARLTKYINATIGVTGKAKLWFTESGGRFDGPTRNPTKARSDFCRAISLARADDHVTRYYHYELDGAGVLPNAGRFDTGLLNSDGTVRDLYGGYKYFSAAAGSSIC